MLLFQPLSMDMKMLVDSYTFKYGEGSCQHSFVSSWCLRDKYGDEVCEHDGFLYTLRSKLCTENERVYLFPLGPRDDLDALRQAVQNVTDDAHSHNCRAKFQTVRQAVQNVLDDAHSHNCRAKFQTLTQSATDAITAMFPGKFTVEYTRDYSEYVYRVDELSDIESHKNIQHFFRKYGADCRIERITKKHIPIIRAFQEKWLAERLADAPEMSNNLITENTCIQHALDSFSMLGMSGIIITIDGETVGYEYGMPLSDDVFDSMAQKGDRRIQDIYRVLSREFPRMCCEGYTWLNWEEDTGSAGLRGAKESYNPAYILRKYIVRENV